MIKIIVVGSRKFRDFSVVSDCLDFYIGDRSEVEIVSGCAGGTSGMGEQYAKSRNLSVKRITAEWDRLGKRAGYIRNKTMANYATHMIAFWDGVSLGTKQMIDLAEKKGLKTRVVNV